MRAVDCGLITLGEALTLYDLSPEEFDAWRSALRRRGRSGLRAALQVQSRPHARKGRATEAEREGR